MPYILKKTVRTVTKCTQVGGVNLIKVVEQLVKLCSNNYMAEMMQVQANSTLMSSDVCIAMCSATAILYTVLQWCSVCTLF